MILLASGLSLARDNSFARQLRLLAGGLRARGRRCLLVGTGSQRRLGEDEADVARIDSTAVDALTAGAPAAGAPAGGAPEAAILLGYPDQFPILAEPGPPLFLWAQLSRPPAARAFGRGIAVPLTERTRAFLERSGVRSPGPTIPHCVDTAQLRPPRAGERERARLALGIDDDALAVGTVAANTTRKRFDLLIEAFGRLARLPALLIVKTDRASSHGGFDIPALARRHGVGDRVRVLCGPLPSLAGLYAALDVYAHASEWEGFGVPIVEAMACGLPVVAADTQGPGETLPYREGLVSQGEWIEEEGGSRLFRVDPGALAAAVDQVAGDPALRARLGDLGRAEAVRRYDVGVVAGQWLAVLDRGFRPSPAAV